MLQQQVPADLFLIVGPRGPIHCNVATDEVARNLVALIECDLGNVGQGQLPEKMCVYGCHEMLVAGPPNVRNGSVVEWPLNVGHGWKADMRIHRSRRALRLHRQGE